MAAVERIRDAHPDVPVCLFVSGARTHTLKVYCKAVRGKLRYSQVWFQDYLPVVAVLWPRTKVEHFMEWLPDAKLPGVQKPWRSDDAVIGSWMKFTKQTVLATVPSLVEHPDDTPSVKWNTPRIQIGKDKRRRAFHYIGDADPLELDWTMI